MLLDDVDLRVVRENGAFVFIWADKKKDTQMKVFKVTKDCIYEPVTGVKRTFLHCGDCIALTFDGKPGHRSNFATESELRDYINKSDYCRNGGTTQIVFDN